MARLPRRVSHECCALHRVLVCRGSAVTVHIARGYRLREQADAHRQPASGGGDGQCDGETDATHSDGCPGEVNHRCLLKANTRDGVLFLTLR
jgi:hypothetical protein